MKKLNEFNTGGLHSENPNGGVPIGGNNTVEEGETKYDNFVFSNRFKVNKSLLKEFNLPGYISNKSYADASKLINNKFKDRSDKVSSDTKNEMLKRLSQMHEYVKLQDNLKNNATEVPELPDPNSEQNKMFLGGNPLTSIQGGMNLIDTAEGNASTDTTGQTLNSAITGASAGSMFGPLGAGIGAGVGLTAGLIGSGKAKKRAEEAAKRQHIKNSGLYENDFAYGGPIKKPMEGTLSDEDFTNNLVGSYNTFPEGAFKYSGGNDYNFKKNDINKHPVEGYVPKLTTEVNTPKETIVAGENNPSNTLNKIGKFGKDHYGDLLRLAPLATNALQLKNLKKSPNVRLDRLDKRYSPTYVDEKSIQNITSNEFDNTINALTSASNGSQGALRNNMLAAGLAKNKALSDAYLKIEDRNRNEDSIGQRFNLDVDKNNINQSNRELDINDRNSAAYDTAKSKLISQLGNDIGSIGKEEVYKKIVKNTFGYNWLGKYIKDNPNASKEQILSDFEKVNKNQNKNGGYISKNKY